MNWLELHLRNFVLPVLKSNMKATALTPFTGVLNPASNCQWRETGILKTALKSWGLWAPTTWSKVSPAVQNAFLEFDLAKVASAGESSHQLSRKPSHELFSSEQIFHTTIKNSVKKLRRDLKSGKKLLLLGRDVWLWAVLCEKYGVPYVYDPRVSRNVANNSIVFAKILSDLGTHEGDVLFDTGFAGTIHRCAEQASGFHLVNLMLSAHNNENQQFKNNGLIRNRALVAEYTPKYFKSGRVQGQKSLGLGDLLKAKLNSEPLDADNAKEPKTESILIQTYTDVNEFVACALLTIWMWNYESPAWIPGPSVPEGLRKKSFNFLS